MKETQTIPGNLQYHVLASVFTFIVLISIGTYFYYIGPGDLPSIFNIVMIVLFVYLFGFWVYSISRLWRKQAGVVITEEQVIDRTNVWGITFIQRKYIDQTRIKKVLGQKWLCIYLKDHEYAYHTNLLNRLFLFIVKLQTGTPLIISETTIRVPVEDLKAVLDR